MTAEELLEEIDDCRGPCGKLCLGCPEGYYLKDIRDVIVNLMNERDKYKQAVELAEEIDGFREMCDQNGIIL